MQSTLRCPSSEMLDLSCKLEARSSERLVFLKTNEYIPNLKLGTKILGSKMLISYYATSFHTMPPGFRAIPNQEDVLRCLKILHLIHFQHFPCQNDHVGKIFLNYFFSFLNLAAGHAIRDTAGLMCLWKLLNVSFYVIICMEITSTLPSSSNL